MHLLFSFLNVLAVVWMVTLFFFIFLGLALGGKVTLGKYFLVTLIVAISYVIWYHAANI